MPRSTNELAGRTVRRRRITSSKLTHSSLYYYKDKLLEKYIYEATANRLSNTATHCENKDGLRARVACLGSFENARICRSLPRTIFTLHLS